MQNAIRSLLIATVGILGTPILVACAKPAPLGVEIHAVNYSGDDFSYVLVDPSNPKTASGGETIAPFAAGGTVCCFALPKKWHPGIMVEIRTTQWLRRLPDGTLPEVKKTEVVEVPPYAEGVAGEMWVLRLPDGAMSVLSSNFQPDHPKWPGKIKGWPVPSIEFRREYWELLKKHEEGGVEDYLALLRDVEKNPQEVAKQFWETGQKYDEAAIKEFSGPDDPRYIVYLKHKFDRGLEQSRFLLDQLMKERP